MLGPKLIPGDLHAIGQGINAVQSQVLCAGDQRQHLVQISKILLNAAGLAGCIPGSLNAAGQLRIKIFKARQVIQLPAIDGQRDLVHAADGFLGIDPPGGINLPGGFIVLAHINNPQNQLL